MNFRYLFLILLISVSCSTTRKPTIKPQSQRGNQYIRKYKDLAIQEMNRTGIPASITLAQGMLESDYGNSTLARKGNNHFGIKCHNGWKGKKIYHDDDRRNECFRKYEDVYQSYIDHSKFLTSSSRYSFLFSYDKTDYKKWARGLKKAGYATSPTYASKLINLIERYRLYQYDNQNIRAERGSSSSSSVSSSSATGSAKLGNVDNYKISAHGHTIRNRNRIDYIVVKRGDTFSSLNEELDLLPWELKKYNELSDDASLKPGQILYLQPKRSKAERGFDIHVAGEGDTMYSISQQYGIKLEDLYEMNRMKKGEKISQGQKIWLRDKKPKNKE
jgi:LysM repeat protein